MRSGVGQLFIKISELIRVIRTDWNANTASKKGRLILPLFRISHELWKLGWIYRVTYLICIVWILGVELPDMVVAGEGLQLYHGQALVVNKCVVLGKNCILRHSTTIGNTILPDGTVGASPVLGDSVELGAHVVIIGDVRIGDGAVIGAGSVVVKDVPPGAVMVGNPARIIKYRY
jgi:putative colanic acid biosynthesis acetyltransferase WcaB